MALDLGSERSVVGSEGFDLWCGTPGLGLLEEGDIRRPEKITLCGIIGRRLLWGRCPKGNEREGR